MSRQYISPKHWYLPLSPHDVTDQHPHLYNIHLLHVFKYSGPSLAIISWLFNNVMDKEITDTEEYIHVIMRICSRNRALKVMFQVNKHQQRAKFTLRLLAC
jgi:hypothetical protein